MKKALAAAFVSFVLFGSLGQAESTEFLEGQEAARKDIKTGELKYMLYGEPQPYDRVLAEVLERDYKVTLVIVGGCTVSVEARERASGYNKVVHDYLNGTTKKEFFVEAQEKARKQWERERAKAEQDASAAGPPSPR